MALLSLSCPSLVCTRNRSLHILQRERYCLWKPSRTSVNCLPTTTANLHIDRPIANYEPAIWDFDYLQSLRSDYVGEKCIERANKLKEAVRTMFDKADDPLATLTLVSTLERLGIAYHFKNQICRALDITYNHHFSTHEQLKKLCLSSKALGFRLLRQHGYHIPQEIFNSLKDESGKFKESLCEDVEGMLNLYEATFLSFQNEKIIDEARDFTTKHLKVILENKKIDRSISDLISHALELPLHWRMVRWEARCFIDVYERSNSTNPTLLELAKLDFNMVQAIHQDDIKYVSRWMKSTRWDQKLTFARDRLMENFQWATGKHFEPEFGNFRRALALTNILLTYVDDVYDAYGTLDELEQFTDFINRWDIKDLEQLPDYLQICFLKLYNTINEWGYEKLAEQGILPIPYLQRKWADLCKTYLQEAKWFYTGYQPTFEEYMDNAWVSITFSIILLHAYLSSPSKITKEALDYFDKYPDIIRYTATMGRLEDDLGTSSIELARGDCPKSIQCYMKDTGASEEEAREHVKYLIGETWKKINEETLKESPFPREFIETVVNLARVGPYMYRHGDGHASQDSMYVARAVSLFVDPVPESNGTTNGSPGLNSRT